LEFDGKKFTTRQIVEKTGLRSTVVSAILFRKRMAGIIKVASATKISGSVLTFRHTGKAIAVRQSHGFVVEKVWAVLKNADRPLSIKEIITKVELLLQDPTVKLNKTIAAQISHWARHDVLKRTGSGSGSHPFKYGVASGITERPVTGPH
jgi:nicotinic acid phosphoribosyltransferase